MCRFRRYRNTTAGRAKRLVADAQKRALKWKLPFDISSEDLTLRLEKGVCEITGIPFCFDAHSPWAPSLERRDSRLGYTKDNVVIAVLMYNVCKNRWSHEDVLEFAQKVLAASGPTPSLQTQKASPVPGPKSVWRV
jgi:hypothetical protein